MQHTDSHILSLLKGGDDKGIEILFQQYFNVLCLRAIRVVKHREIAEDLVQELFLEIWNKRDRINITSSFKSYLSRSIVNRSLNWLRANKQVFEDAETGLMHKTDNYSISAEIQKDELESYLNECIDELPEKCRLVFILSRYEELSYKEIANKLEISVKTVENQISKALKLLRIRLETYNSKY